MKKLLFSVSFVAVLALGSCAKDGIDAYDNPSASVMVSSVEETLAPLVGGPNEQNQVYVKLEPKAGEMTVVQRDLWDLGFYSGSEFRVILNTSVKMAAKKLNTTDITLVQEKDTTMIVGHNDNILASRGIVDDPTGVLTGAGGGKGTAIAEISANPDENYVYLVNLGFYVGTKDPDKGSVEPDGDLRGWKKIRILRNGNGYKIQYADLTSATYEERTIQKDPTYNFTFLSMATGLPVTIEPPKAAWDLCFTTFTNYTDDTVYTFDPSRQKIIVYPMVDVVVTNMKAGTQVYEVIAKDGDGLAAYENFKFKEIDDKSFIPSTTDQRIIGTNWRDVMKRAVATDRFYVVKEGKAKEAKYYKVLFTAMSRADKERGHPIFEYKYLGIRLPEDNSSL